MAARASGKEIEIMEKVLGVGGVFYRTKDRKALCSWYRDNLGLDVDESWFGAVLPAKHENDRDTAATVWGTFAEDADYFGSLENAFMVNFRVRDLHAMLAQLREKGCDVLEKTDESAFGKFGWVTDPEGRRIELWEPPLESPV
jgi:predicted enzyme related to lactoylglutathione lyase